MDKYVCSGVNALQQTAHWAILLGTNRSYAHTAFVCITWLSSHALCRMRFSACISSRVFTISRRFAWTFSPSSVASELSYWPIDRFLRYVCVFVPILITAPLCWSVSFCKHVSSIGESDSLCPMQWRRRYSGSRLLETRSRQGIWEVTLYNLLPSTLASHLITLNGNVYRPLAQTATCIYHDEETNISQKTVDRSVRQHLARDTIRKKSPCKPSRDRKYTRRNASRKTHPSQGVTTKSRDTYKRSVNIWMVCAQQDGSMSSLLQCVDSRAYVLVHAVGPLTVTQSRTTRIFWLTQPIAFFSQFTCLISKFNFYIFLNCPQQPIKAKIYILIRSENSLGQSKYFYS